MDAAPGGGPVIVSRHAAHAFEVSAQHVDKSVEEVLRNQGATDLDLAVSSLPSNTVRLLLRPVVAARLFHLNRGARGSPARHLVEHALGALTLHDEVRDLVGVLLVAVTDLPDTALEAHASALLHHMCGLVGRGVECRRRPERDVVARGVRDRADVLARAGRRATHVGADAGDVVTTEGALNFLKVRERPAAATDTLRRRLLHVGLSAGARGLRLNRRVGASQRAAHQLKRPVETGALRGRRGLDEADVGRGEGASGGTRELGLNRGGAERRVGAPHRGAQELERRVETGALSG